MARQYEVFLDKQSITDQLKTDMCQLAKDVEIIKTDLTSCKLPKTGGKFCKHFVACFFIHLEF